MQRKPFAVAIICLTICLFGTFLQWQYGIFCRYNYITALSDKHNGKLQLLTYGKELVTVKQRKIVSHQLGFDVNTIAGCAISDAERNGAEVYNSVMNKAIGAKLGEQWKVKFETQVDSLFRDQSVPRIYNAVMKLPDVIEYIHKCDSVKHGLAFIKVVKVKDTAVPNAMLCFKIKGGYSIGEYFIVDPYSLRIRRILY